MKSCPLRLSVFKYGNRFPIVKFEIGSIMLKSFKTKSPITLQTLSLNLSVMSEICVALMLLFLGVYFFCFDVWCFICNIWPWQWQWPSMKLWCLSQSFDNSADFASCTFYVCKQNIYVHIDKWYLLNTIQN